MRINQIESTDSKWWLEIEQFHSGSFTEADDSTKKAWNQFFCAYMLTLLNNKVKKNLVDMARKRLGTFISSCDEAFVIYLLKRNANDWYKYCNKDMEYLYQNTKSPSKRKNVKVNVGELTELTNDIGMQQMQNETGREWDEGFLKYCKELLEKSKSERLSQDSVSLYTQTTVEDPPNLAKKWKKQYAYLEMNDSFNCETDINDDKDDNST